MDNLLPQKIKKFNDPFSVQNKDGVIYTFTHYYYGLEDSNELYFIGRMKNGDMESCCVSPQFHYNRNGEIEQIPNFEHDVLAYKKILRDSNQNDITNNRDLLSVSTKTGSSYTPEEMLDFYDRMDELIPAYIKGFAEKFSKRFGVSRVYVEKKLTDYVKHMDLIPIDYIGDDEGYWIANIKSIHIEDFVNAKKLKAVLDHEFTHALTQGKEEIDNSGKRTIKCGFLLKSSKNKSKKWQVKYRALNEGATEWVASKTTVRQTLTYYFDVGMFKCVKDLVGEDKTIKYFLNNDTEALIRDLSCSLDDCDYPHKMLEMMDNLHEALSGRDKTMTITDQEKLQNRIAVEFVEQLERVVENAKSTSDLEPIKNCIESNFLFLDNNVKRCDRTNEVRMSRLYHSMLDKYKQLGIDLLAPNDSDIKLFHPSIKPKPAYIPPQ